MTRSRRGVIESRSGERVKVHEYQAKQILKRFGVDVPRGDVAFSPRQAGAEAARLGGKVV